jgi:hypothetical protein
MTLNSFLKLQQGGEGCVSIIEMPYNTICEEWSFDELRNDSLYKTIKTRQIDHFSIIGGGCYKIELCIYLKES